MILSGKPIAYEIYEELRHTIAALPAQPGLAVVLVGENPSSIAYTSTKRKACAAVGIRSFYHPLPNTVSEKDLLGLIDHLNRDTEVHGILVQLPLPPHIHTQNIIEAIDPRKDVDGFHPTNIGRLLLGLKGGFVPCTPLGIKVLLERANISVEGQDIVIAGRSNIVGKPLAALWMQNASTANATITVVHSKTRDLAAHTRRADILVAALGSPHFIKEDMIKEGAVVIDVGISRETNPNSATGYSLVGDVDFKRVEKKCKAITPVPGGVGPMTVAMLLQNTLQAFRSLSV